METCGICYVANTDGYIAEALKSLFSLRQIMPNIAVCIIAPRGIWRQELTDVRWIDASFERKGPIVKVAAGKSPFDRTLFLDTDTFVARDLAEIFDLLDVFDMALAHEATRGWDYPCSAPKAFCEFNTGVMLFKKNKAVTEFFQAWPLVYDDLLKKHRINNDQASFRETAWRSQIRIATLPTEYHVFTAFGTYVAWEAKLLHGRGDLARIAFELNAKLCPRTYNPAFGVALPFVGVRSLARNYIQMSLNFFKVILKRRDVHAGQAPVAWHHERAKNDEKV